MFSQEERYILNKNQLGDVICQLRFPEILLITAKAPVDFQEEIRQDFPQYACLKKKSPATSALPAHQPAESNAPSVIHQFSSADGKWKVLLCSSSISLSCSNYVRWEEFANMLDKPLAAFIKIYKPAYFQRIGLRYLNFISKKAYP